MHLANTILLTGLSVKTEPQKAYFSLFKNMFLDVLYFNIHFGLHLTFLKQVTVIYYNIIQGVFQWKKRKGVIPHLIY